MSETRKTIRVLNRHIDACNDSVYIGRPSKWGNPFVIGKDGSRTEVVSKYEAWLLQQPTLLASLPELKDKSLSCWCSPHACHGDVLFKLANAREASDATV
jgi:hypothetical protein